MLTYIRIANSSVYRHLGYIFTQGLCERFGGTYTIFIGQQK